jgi:hypothetical protein
LVAETAPNNQDIVTKTVLVKSTEIVTVIQLPGNTTYGPTYGWKQSAQVKTTRVPFLTVKFLRGFLAVIYVKNSPILGLASYCIRIRVCME